ncbi:replication protein VP4 [Gokushovirinae Fen7875_21]|uniref:replication protein VP4 n=1 Tax=Gokushovirinae Fen7875_21 TaxID=1655659 RepID=UPI00063D619A|nr:replication protein VP4 [Gokushovirinae Fen7875_21]AKI26940.1 replication protein VP4 [Gokushovirinae Fen7875_21]ALS03710.1 VP4 [Gokushovirus WZ-2015a]
MPCKCPLPAFQLSNGSVVFSERRGQDVVRSLFLPCGQCTLCRLARAKGWAIRCLHEASLFPRNCFLTLTYRTEELPERGSLNYSDFQLFMKRFRKRVSPVQPRFYMCGEYGDQDGRPHFHACIFGYDFEDKVPWKKTDSGSLICRSSLLETLWTKGHSSIGEVNFQTAAYVARYCMKKVTGSRAQEHYTRIDLQTGELYSLEPEFTHMSLKPGIGREWFDKYFSDVYPHDYVVVNGRTIKPPKYYDQKFKELEPLGFEQLQYQRELDAALRAADNTPERLLVKEVCAAAALSRFKRSI